MADDDVQRMRERLDQLCKAVGIIDRTTASIKATCGPCKADVVKLDRTVQQLDALVRGNGGEGMRSEVVGLRSDVGGVIESQKQVKGFLVDSIKWQRKQMVAMIAALLGIVGIVVNHYLP